MRKTFILLTIVLLLFAFSAVYAQESGGDRSLYDKAYELYQNGKYYKAHEMFIQSQYDNWEAMAKKCIRRWPKNGELWHDETQWLRDTNLTFKVDQPSDMAVFVRIYKDDKPLSYVFVGGKDTVTVGVPGNGTYVIMDGVGSDWYGTTDSFGENGAYETMTFGPREEPFIYLMARYNYTITINVEDAIGEDVGTEDAEWADFQK